MADERSKKDSDAQKNLIVWGIGSSAGGLEALQLFINGLNPETPVAYVVAQHLSPTHKSLLVDLLSKESPIEIAEARNGQVLKAGKMYICPPNKNIEIVSHHIRLSSAENSVYFTRPSVDLMLGSMAATYKEKCAAIILSGTGSDGARGIRAVKAEGGITVVQDPVTAKYDGMPESAVITGAVDLVLPAERIGTELFELFSQAKDRPNFLPNDAQTEDLIKGIIFRLTSVKSVDFSQYKLNTIKRRIERRIAAKKISTVKEYYNLITKDQNELDTLFNDIFINVTAFFRDPEMFESLKKHFEHYSSRKDEFVIRIWVAGCSTGEEAYTIGILLKEIFKNDLHKYKAQIFATDVDQQALQIARTGRYSQSALANLPEEIISRYFVSDLDQYRISSEIREMCVFSLHDMIKDPPFLRMDLVSCRNTLIYFATEAQQEVIQKFHYALKKNGILFLGPSETVGKVPGLYFDALDLSGKIFSVGSYAKRYKHKTRSDSFSYEEPKPVGKIENVIHDRILEKLNEFILPTCVVINEALDLVYIKGANPYMVRPQGESTDHIYKNIHPELSVELRTALLTATKDNDLARSPFKKIQLHEQLIKYVQLTVMPLHAEGNPELYLICFQEENETFASQFVNPENLPEDLDNQLQLELKRTKEHMQTLLEEMETTNEEVQAVNEELQASNEELQSSNEELETTNEELQSTNEELHSAYAEMQETYEAKKEESEAHQKTKEQLEVFSERLKLAINVANLGLADQHVPIQKNDFWSGRFAEIFGYQLGELPSEAGHMRDWFAKHIEPEHYESYMIAFERFIRGESVYFSYTLRIRQKTGVLRWVRQNARAIARDREGRVLRLISVFYDITTDTEQKLEISRLNEKLEKIVLEQKEEIAQQQERLSQIVQELGVGVWEWVFETDSVYLSPEFLKQYGVSFAKMPENLEEFCALFDPVECSGVRDKLEQVKRGFKRYGQMNMKMQTDNELPRWVRMSFQANIEKDQPVSVVGYLSDVTREVEREGMLEQINSHLSLIQKLAEIGSYDFNPEKQMFWRNESYCHMLGLNPTNGTLASLQEFLSWMNKTDQIAYKSFMEDIQHSIEIHNIDYRIVTPNGAAFLISERAQMCQAEKNEGTIQGIIQIKEKE